MTRKKYWTGTKKAPAQDRFFIEALDPDLWSRGDSEDWDTLWQTGMPAKAVFANAKPSASINHIPGNNSLTIKSRLFDTLSKADARAPSADLREKMAFFPHSYSMPEEYHALQAKAFAEPDRQWIVKPKRLSRGRGIEVIGDAGAAPLGKSWLVQDYLGRPDLIEGHKYVLRCYLLITSIDPLQVYLYKDGFVKLASEPYDDDIENLFAHLTNPDVNALNEAVEQPVVFYSFDEYRNMLSKRDIDPGPIFQSIRDMGIMSAIAAQNSMRTRTDQQNANPHGCYELIGMDCMVDADMKPWLLECNLSPSLDVCAAADDGGAYEFDTKRAVVHDLVTLLDLNNPDRTIIDESTDQQAIDAAIAQTSRAGRFEQVYPAGDVSAYLPLLGAPRYRDLALAQAVSDSPITHPTLHQTSVRELIDDDTLSLYNEHTGKMYTPEAGSAFIWLHAANGETGDSITTKLIEASGVDDAPATRAAYAKEVTNLLNEWVEEGLLVPEGAQTPACKTTSSKPAAQTKTMTIDWQGDPLQITYTADEIGERLDGLFLPYNATPYDTADQLTILPGNIGYALSSHERLIYAGLRLSDLGDRLARNLLDRVTGEDAAGHVLQTAFLERDGDAILVANGAANLWDGASLSICAQGLAQYRGANAQTSAPGHATALPLPARRSAGAKPVFAAGAQMPGKPATWRGCRNGKFVPHPDLQAKTSAKPIKAIIVPRHATDDREPGVVALTGQKERLVGLTALYRRSTTHKHPPLEYLDWAADIPIFEIWCRDDDDLAKAIAQIV